MKKMIFIYSSLLLNACNSVDNLPPKMTGPFIKANKSPEISALNWQLVPQLSDEFNDNSIDLSKWQIEPQGNGWGWIGRPPGLFKADNVKELDGNLTVEVSELPTPQTVNNDTFLYQGAIIRSLQAGQPGWYYETRMKANATEMSSTFWLMTKGDTVKKLELDIQECVGKRSDNAEPWSTGWDQIFHSNTIHRSNQYNPTPVQIQDYVTTETKNHERYYVYAAWWKSTSEIRFYLDGEYVYSLTPPIDWDVPAFIQMAIETYSWNPIPNDGGMIRSGTKEQRTTSYDWVRVWQIKS